MGFLLGKTHLIMDRDPVFTADVRAYLQQCRRAASAIARAEPESKRLRGTLRALDQERVFGSARSSS